MTIFRRLTLIAMLQSCSLGTYAQVEPSWEDFAEQSMDEAEEDGEAGHEQLAELLSHPINLNQASVEELMQLPFLNEEQARDIVFYRFMHGPMRSTGELMFIETLSKQDRDNLQLFCYAGEPEQNNNRLTTSKLLKHTQHELILRTDIPFYYKAGQQDYSDEVLAKYPNRKYRGDPLHGVFRYRLSSMNHLFAGVQMEKDAGERSIDFLSGHIMLKDIQTGRQSSIREAILGDYRAHFGLGLAINNGINFGKAMMINSLGRMDRGFSKHSSTMETAYLRGAAIRFQYRSLTVSALGSYNKKDGTFLSDSTGISSLKTDGLHRTPLERSKKHNISEVTIGGNIHWEWKSLQLSATAISTHYSIPLKPKWDTPSTLYRKYNAQGQNFQVYSVGYAWQWQRLRFAGETAMSHAAGLDTGAGRQQGVATLNTLQYRISHQHTLSLAVRYYGAKFVSINGKAFGENASPQNEEGVFIAWKTSMIPGLNLDTYVDLMYFPWLKYGVSNRSYGVDGMVQASYRYSQRSRWLIRYKLKSKQKDFNYGEDTQEEEEIGTNEAGTAMRYNRKHSLKIQHNLSVGKSWTFRTMLNGCIVDTGHDAAEKGFSVGEHIRWTGHNERLRLDFAITFFNSDSYNARIYSYEPSLLYSFGLTSYFYKGIRSIAMVNWNIYKKLTFTAKFGLTKYFNRDSIGTGTELIAANHREDLQLMVRWKF